MPSGEFLRTVRADGVYAQGMGGFGFAAIGTGAALNGGQQVAQPADGDRLGRAARPNKEHATHARVAQGQDQRRFHLLLSDDGQEGQVDVIGQPSGRAWLRVAGLETGVPVQDVQEHGSGTCGLLCYSAKTR